MLADLLAIAGDVGDGIPGVDGLGFGKAAAILRSFGTLEAALSEPVWTEEQFDAARKQVVSLGRDAKKVGALALAIIQDPAVGGVLVAEREGTLVGMFAFHVGTHFFGHDTFASDVVMYLKPGSRGGSVFPRLVRAFEEWADEHGVKEKILGVSAGIDHERTVAVLERMGYARTATGTVKGK